MAIPVLSGIDALVGVAGGKLPITCAPRRGQFFRALEDSGSGRVSTVAAAVPADPGDATNIAFNHTTFVLQSGVLAQFVMTTLGLTATQLTTIINNARSVTE